MRLTLKPAIVCKHDKAHHLLVSVEERPPSQAEVAQTAQGPRIGRRQQLRRPVFFCGVAATEEGQQGGTLPARLLSLPLQEFGRAVSGGTLDPGRSKYHKLTLKQVQVMLTYRPRGLPPQTPSQ